MNIKQKILLALLTITAGLIVFFYSIPFFELIILSVIVSFLMHPLKKKMMKRIKNEKITAILLTLLSLVLIIIVSFLFLTTLISGVKFFNELLTNNDSSESINNIVSFLESFDISEPLTREGVQRTVDFVQDLILSSPRILLGIFVFLLFTYYLLEKEDEIKQILISLVPPGEIVYFKKFYKKMQELFKGVIIIQLAGAASQSLIILIFLLILRVPYWLEFTFMAFMLSALGLTSALVILFLIIYYIIAANYNYVIILSVLMLIAVNIDDLVKPLIAKKVIHANPLLVLLGIIGGATTLGATGLIIGPIIALTLQSSIKEVFEK